MNLQHVLEGLDRSGLSVSLIDEWDAGWCAELEDLKQPILASLDEVAEWLHAQAQYRHPESAYAKNASNIADSGAARGFELPCVLLGLFESEYRVGISNQGGRGWSATVNLERKRLPSLDKAAQWLHEEALRQGPDSHYALNASSPRDLEKWLRAMTEKRERAHALADRRQFLARAREEGRAIRRARQHKPSS